MFYSEKSFNHWVSNDIINPWIKYYSKIVKYISYGLKIIIILSFIVTKYSGSLGFNLILWKVMFKSLYRWCQILFSYCMSFQLWLISITTPGQHKTMIHNKTSEWYEIWCQNSTQIWIRLNVQNTCFTQKLITKYWQNFLVSHDITL